MTLIEKNQADQASSQVELVDGFSNKFRSSVLNNLEDGEEFTIPDKYQVFKRKIGDRTAEYINVVTNKGRTVEFYPTAMTRAAFVVDEKTGKDVIVDGRRKVVRPEGNVVKFIDGKAINPTMEAMKGCTISYGILDRYPTRVFGVDNDKATAKDVQKTIVGKWNFVGDKRPEGFVE